MNVLRQIQGGSGGTLTAEDVEQVTAASASAMKPTVERVDALAADVAALRAENATLKEHVRVQGEGDGRRFLLNGQEFPLGKGIAPGHLRSGSLGDRPLLLSDFPRMMLSIKRGGDLGKFSYVKEVSAKLLKFGHVRDDNTMGTLLPITSNPDYFYTGSDESEAFVREIKDAAWRDHQPEETAEQVRWLFAKMASKGVGPQASDNDLLGGSLAGLPMTGDIIPLLQATAVLGRAGARAVPLPPTGMRWPRETSAPVFAYVNENGTIPFTDVSTGVMNMSPKKAGAIIKIPNELLLMVNAAESFFRSALVKAAALTEDVSGLEGVGSQTTPRGIIRWDRSANDVPADGKVTLHTATGAVGANGDTFGPNDPTLMKAALENANYPNGPTAFLMRPNQWSYIRNLRAGAGAAGDGGGGFLFNFDRGIGETLPKALDGVPVFTSTQVSKTQIKNNGLTLTYVLGGDFSQVYLGRVGAIELATDMSLGFAEEQVWVRAIYRHDVSLAQAQAMCICPTLLNG